ncbi:MAG TPA: alpha-glucosidase C-terminal domain-containing protein, partial [Candidatus Acidoferrum sp.]
AEYNVAVESKEPDSILSFYKRLLALRESEAALRDMQYGSYVSLDRDNPYVLAFLRKHPGNGDSVLVVLNMSGQEQTVKLDLAGLGIQSSSAKPLLASPEIDKPVPLADLKVAPFGVFIGSVH